MNKILFFIILVLLFSCSKLRKTDNNIDKSDLVFKEISHGIYKTTTEKIEKQSNSPTGNYLMTYSTNLIKSTDTIPGEIGVNFGLEYQLLTKNTKDIELKKVWIFPQTILDNNGKKFREYTHMISVVTNDTNFTSYVLEKDFEIVKGKWTIQLYYENKLLYEKYFIIK